ncbi:hypothetical protein DOK67_0001111 [Enterococcus sp. DIV0212c]|nr:hypothetical protein [Enterococcus sp. DIV0212c]
MKLWEKISDFFDDQRRKKYKRLREKNDALRAKGKNPVKNGWGKMVNTGTGGMNQDRTTRVYDVAQQQKNISEEHEVKERRSGEVKIKQSSDKQKRLVLFCFFCCISFSIQNIKTISSN